ncbi:transcriptional regulator [Glaesserella parasuis]|nr:transcriptional regulator [Glaesserella parasuis]MDE4000455.1 transcriptional regulator [Glaesserella parasuis]
MAKKAKAEKEKRTAELEKGGADETKDTAGNSLQSDSADSANATDEKVADAKADGEVIHPIAFEITLKAIHPQASYGRCGYRFTKDKAVEIPFDALTGEQIIALSQDPYLELVPICEK